MRTRKPTSSRKTGTRAKQLKRALRLQLLENRQLLAFNVVDDTFNILTPGALNVLTNDTSGVEVQSVSAMQVDFDRATYNRGVNATDFFIPERPGQPGVPQRSLVAGGITTESGNRGDLDLYLDTDTDPSNDDNTLPRLVSTDGVVLPVVRDNSPVDATTTNLAVLQYVVDSASTWIAMAGGPENGSVASLDGEHSVPISAALFPYSGGWIGGSIDESLNETAGGTGISVTGGGASYTVAVDGVTNSFEDGYLFSVAGDNSDNYARARPIGGNEWSVRVRDNSGALASSDPDPISVLYIPRGAQGLTGGVVKGSVETPNPMVSSYGDFSVNREVDGLWRLSVPGQSVTSGVLVIESADQTVSEPRNAYFTYDGEKDSEGNLISDDILIRQFEWTASDVEQPLNTDFVFFFIPFENTLAPAPTGLTLTSVGTTADPLSGVSESGTPLSINADGTIHWDFDLASKAAGETGTDVFVYTVTDGSSSLTGTASINWSGVNDAPEVIASVPNFQFDEDGSTQTLDLATVFSDPDLLDTLSFQANPGLGELVDASVTDGILSITPLANKFGFTQLTLVATDPSGATASVTVGVDVTPVADDVIANDDDGFTDKVTPVTIAVLGNDMHPDTTPFSVSSALIGGNPGAAGDSDTVWTIDATNASPNALTIQSAPNRGDVAVGREGVNLDLAEGVFLGTVRDDTAPYQTVNTYAAFGSYGFATDTGVGGGERNSPLHAGFFPFGEQWTSGHVDAAGNLLAGVGVSSADVTKISTGLFQVTIPEAANAASDGLLFAMSGANDDNIVSVLPSTQDNTWLIRQMDSDSNIDGFEDDAWSFVYIPGDQIGLFGGRFGGEEEGRQLQQAFGGINAFENFGAGEIFVDIPNYSAADGALIAISSGSVSSLVGGISTIVPANQAVMAIPADDGVNDFKLVSRQSSDYASAVNGDVQFIFLPFDAPLERIDGLEFGITNFDTTSALGATISQNADGTFTYDPSAAGSPIADLGNGENLQDTFTYTITDGRGGTSTATVTVTVQGENSLPDANDDTVNLNELTASSAALSVLRNDTDPDLEFLFGTPQGTAAANLAVDGSSVWSVAGTGTGGGAISLGAGTTGDVEVLRDGNPIAPTDGVVLASVRENFDGANTNFRFVQAYGNVGGGTSLAVGQFGADAAADAPVSLAYFPFADNWIGGHVDPTGVLTAGNGVSAGDIVRTSDGRYTVSIPGVSDAAREGLLFVIGNENADNVVQSRAVPLTNTFEIAVRDNQQDFGNGEDGGFSFVFIPSTAENLVAGVVDPFSELLNPTAAIVGEFELERLEVATGGFEWKLTIPGQSPDTGVLLLTNQDNSEIEDNFLSYQDDGTGSFLLRSHDMPSIGRQNQPFSFMFVPFENPGKPVYRPVSNPLLIQSVDATSNLGAALSINADGTIQYDAAGLFLPLYAGESATDTFSYTMTDGFGGVDTATVTVVVQGFGDAPFVATSGEISYYGLGDSPVGIDPGADLVEVGAPRLDGAVVTVELTAGGVSTDEMSVRNEGTDPGQIGVSGTDVTFGGTVIGTFAGGSSESPLVVTLNSDATGESVDALLRAISFSNTDSATLPGLRSFSFSIVDETGRGGGVAGKQLEVGLLRKRDLQKGVDTGFGVYTAVQDAQLRENAPSVVTAPAAPLLVDFDGSGNTSQVLLKYEDLFGTGPGQIPPGSVIMSAKLIVDSNTSVDGNSPGDGARMYRMIQDWDDSTATWDSFNAGLSTISGELPSTFASFVGLRDGSGNTGSGVLEFSVLDDVRAWADGETNYGWAMIGWDGNTDGWLFGSSEASNAASRPRLSIEWLPAGAFEAASFQQGVNGYAGTVDTQIASGGNADTEFSTADSIFVDDPGVQALIRFEDIFGTDAGQIPLGSRIISARLLTASTQGNAMGDGGKFHKMLTPWSDTDTYNTLVDGISIDGVEADSNFNAAAGNASRNPNVQAAWNGWDVTADLQSWSFGEIANNGWVIDPWASGTDGWGFRSSEIVDDPSTSDVDESLYRPRLEVYYTADFNMPPTNIMITPDEISEFADTTGGLLVGSLDAVDPNPGDTFTYELLPGVNDNALFTINGDQLEINDGVALDYETRPEYVVNIRAIDAGGLTFERELMIRVINEIEVEGITVGDGSAQRSRVDGLTISFDSDVTIGSGAIEVVKRGADGGSVDVTVSSEVVEGKTVATLTFAGGFTEFGSLVDGNYQLRIDGSLITNSAGLQFDGDGDGQPGGDLLFGADEADNFFRFYGDTDGNRSVNFGDFGIFRTTFGVESSSEDFIAELDFEANGSVGFSDFNAFRSRFGVELPF